LFALGSHLPIISDSRAAILTNDRLAGAKRASPPRGGGRLTIGASGSTRCFAGQIDDVAIYASALTPDQVRTDVSRLPY
jgi:hypothetical protein